MSRLLLDDFYLILNHLRVNSIEFKNDGKTYANNKEIDLWEVLYKAKKERLK